jgi:hypothetical protein
VIVIIAFSFYFCQWSSPLIGFFKGRVSHTPSLGFPDIPKIYILGLYTALLLTVKKRKAQVEFWAVFGLVKQL